MTRILVLCSDPSDATSFYRGMGPMARLGKEYRNINIELLSDLNWYTIKHADILFMQRPFNEVHLAAAQMAKTSGLKLWIDYDDDFFSIPKENSAFYVYSTPESQKRLTDIAELTDVMTVSTPALQDVFSKLHPNVRVIPNALDDEVCKRRYPLPTQSEKYILWRGGPSHERDLDSVHDSLVALSHEALFADWKWFFLGLHPWKTMEKMKPKSAFYGSGTDILRYINIIYQMQPRIMIVPLADIPFNHSKSNIAWIEGSYAGAMVLAKDMPEWRRPGVFNYTDAASFDTKLTALVKLHNAGCNLLNDDSWYYILENLTAKHTSKLRNDIVEELVGK